MTQPPADWGAERGDRWCAGLAEMEATLQPVDEPFINALALDGPRRIVEVGCGGGGTALEILRRAPSGTFVHGVDISPALIGAARSRIPPDEHAIAFDVADMATAPTPDVGYDRLASRFSVMFFDDPPRAFSNLARWLAPGARIALAVWGQPTENPWIDVREGIATIVDVPLPDPDAPGPFRYADVGKLLTLLERAGFADLDAQPWKGSLPVGGGLPATEAAAFLLAFFSNFAELLAAAGPDALQIARESLTTQLRTRERDGAVWLDACAHLVTGTHP